MQLLEISRKNTQDASTPEWQMAGGAGAVSLAFHLGPVHHVWHYMA
jgi:hypothetical protein